MKKLAKHPEDMNAAELAQATKMFDKPFVFEQARPMTRSERGEEHRLRRGSHTGHIWHAKRRMRIVPNA